MIKVYKYRLLPTDEQKQKLAHWFGCCRFIYNLALETRIAAWASARVNLSSYDLMKQVTVIRNEVPWLAECGYQCLESAVANMDKAYKGFFRGSGFPKFKKRSNEQAIHFRQSSKVDENKVYLSKFGWVEFILHRPLGEGQLRAVTVRKTAAGSYFISIMVKDAAVAPDKKPLLEETAVGIDVGLKTFATLSDGQTFDNPKYLHQQLQRLKKEQRTLARRYKRGVKISEQSKGYHKQRLIVAKLHETISNKRQDFLHKTSTAIIKQFDTVCLEDLNVKGMMKNGKLSKAIADVSWTEFNRMLEYKAERHGKNIHKIGRFEPSSKICSTCGVINSELKLSDREWGCAACGTHHDRDLNAAKNIKSFGFKAEPSSVNVNRKVKRIGCKTSVAGKR